MKDTFPVGSVERSAIWQAMQIIGTARALDAAAVGEQGEGASYAPTLPDAVAVLANLRMELEALPIRRELISGQTFSYVQRDNVMALIEQAELNFSKPWPGIRDLCKGEKL